MLRKNINPMSVRKSRTRPSSAIPVVFGTPPEERKSDQVSAKWFYSVAKKVVPDGHSSRFRPTEREPHERKVSTVSEEHAQTGLDGEIKRASNHRHERTIMKQPKHGVERTSALKDSDLAVDRDERPVSARVTKSRGVSTSKVNRSASNADNSRKSIGVPRLSPPVPKKRPCDECRMRCQQSCDRCCRGPRGRRGHKGCRGKTGPAGPPGPPAPPPLLGASVVMASLTSPLTGQVQFVDNTGNQPILTYAAPSPFIVTDGYSFQVPAGTYSWSYAINSDTSVVTSTFALGVPRAPRGPAASFYDYTTKTVDASGQAMSSGQIVVAALPGSGNGSVGIFNITPPPVTSPITVTVIKSGVFTLTLLALAPP